MEEALNLSSARLLDDDDTAKVKKVKCISRNYPLYVYIYIYVVGGAGIYDSV